MRQWKSMAMAGAWLAAAGCGGGGGADETARRETESMGGEVARTQQQRGEDEYGTYTETETWEVPPPGTTSEPMAREEPQPYGGPESPPHYGEAGTSEEYGAAGGMEQPGTEEPGMREPELARNALCPADIEGLNVRVSTIPRGGALVLTASGDQEVEELRDRLDRFAQMHRRHHTQGAMPEQGAMGEPGAMGEEATMGEHRGHEMGAAGEPQFADASALIHQATEIRVVEIPRGARLEVRMDDEAQVPELRAELREDATMLREGLCPLALQLES